MFNKKRIVSADIQRSQLGVVGLNNVSVVDTRISKLSNDYQNYVDTLIALTGIVPVYPTTLPAYDVQASTINALPGIGLTTDDKIAIIALPAQPRAYMIKQYIAALSITEKYTQFSQGDVHTVEIIPFFGSAADTVNSRVLTVDATGAVNTTSEYVVLPAVQPSTLGVVKSIGYGAGELKFQAEYGRSAANYLAPWCMQPYNGESQEAYTAIAVIFKGKAGDDKNQYSVLPIFGGLQAAHLVAEILNK